MGRRANPFYAVRLKDEVIRFRDGYAVVFNNKIQSPRWLDKDAAEAFLTGLQDGTRKEEVAE